MLAPAVSRLETHAHTHTRPLQPRRSRSAPGPAPSGAPQPSRCPPPGMEYFVVPAQKMPSLQHFRKSEKEVIGGLCRWGRAVFRSALFISTFFFFFFKCIYYFV